MAQATRQTKKPWTSRELTTLKNLARAKTPTRVIGKKLGRTPRAIYDKAFKENISLRSFKQLSWTAQDISQLKRLIKANTPTRLIGEKLGRSPRAIYNKAFKEKISLRSADKTVRYRKNA